MYKKIKNALCIKDIDKFEEVIWNKFRAIVPFSVPYEIIEYRFQHMKTVSSISYKILLSYLKDKSASKKLSKYEQKQLNIIKKHNLETTIIFISMIHDIYKFVEDENIEHGDMASKFFKNFCKMNNIKIKGIVSDMFEAIKKHSDKDIKSKNIYLNILRDADMLSKLSSENIQEKMQKLNISGLEELKKITNIINTEYQKKSHTVFFNDILKDMHISIVNDMYRNPSKYKHTKRGE